MPIKIDFLSNVRDFLRGTDAAEDALKDVADSLDDMARDAKAGGEKAERSIEKLEDSFLDAAKRAKALGKAGNDAGDDVKKGMKGAEDGVDELKDEANATAKETAASFDGSAESILGAFQEVAANAFAGFGPAGALAGLAIAAGIGLATAEFQKAADAAEELRTKAVEYAGEARDAGVSTESWLSSVGKVAERIQELEELKSTDQRFFWEEDPSQLEDWVGGLDKMHRSADEVAEVLASSDDAMKDYRDAIVDSRKAIQDERDAIVERTAAQGESTDADKARFDALTQELEGTKDVLEAVDQEIQLRDQARESSDRQRTAGVDDALARAAAEQEMADAITTAEQQVQDSVLSAYDNMRTAATEFATTEEGALDINRWLTYTQEHAASVATYQANLASMKLTPEQWSNLMEMPEESRAQWVAQFVALPENARQPYATALNNLGSDGGNQAAVGFEDSFNPDADVEIQVDDTRARRELKDLVKPRTAEVKVKTTGKADARDAIDKVAKDRTATIRVNADLWAAQGEIDRFIARNNNRRITIYGVYVPPRIGRGYIP
jgi:hypothetical protein